MSDLDVDIEALAGTLRESTVAVRLGRSGGSGVIWSRDGIIITNAHVANRPQARIVLADGREFEGRVERRDTARDLALVRIDAHGLPAVQVRDPATLRVGEMLVAVGHPLGIPNALTMGILHAPVGTRARRFVQADLHLAPGNSGGPLADTDGRVVGINSMVVDGSLALAVPSDDVAVFAGASGAVRAPLGVRLAAVRLREGKPALAVIGVEPGSRAERAGLLLGDVIAGVAPEQLRARSSVDVLRGGRPVRVLLPAAEPDARAA